MARPRRTHYRTESAARQMSRGVREVLVLALVALAVFFAIALLTFDPADGGWTRTPRHMQTANLAGRVGANIADVTYFALGWAALLVPVLLGLCAAGVYRAGRATEGLATRATGVRVAGGVLVLAAATVGAQLFLPAGSLDQYPGGVLGQELGGVLLRALGEGGAVVALLLALLVGTTLLARVSWLGLLESVGMAATRSVAGLAARVRGYADEMAGQRAREARRVAADRHRERRPRQAVRVEPVLEARPTPAAAPEEQQIELFELPPGPTALPPLTLLDASTERPTGVAPEALEAQARRLELKLEEFGVDAQVVAVHPGPVITRFELELAAGVKVAQVSNLAKDLARALSVVSVRVVEVIPGKPTVGVEIPNEQRETIRLADTLRAGTYQESASPLTLALGKDIQGAPVVADIARMPHLLVSGTTGSGKSVAINAMVLSLLFKATPEQVRLIMIDPKMLELSVYEGIPHLLCPVVTDMNDAYAALNWCVGEMERRYQRMAALGVRNLATYNRRVSEAAAAGAPIPDPLGAADGEEEPPPCPQLPYIVVLVDEFADMMMLVGKKVEQLIARLAQKARASGVHLVLATQRPSVDVITGLIKANIPTRIAFQVSSKVDSRTILDQMGAEQLLGHGDMLYLPPGTSIPNRVHGAFVSDEEVHRVVAHLRAQRRAEYDPSVLQPDLGGSAGDYGGGFEAGGNGSAEGQDELYDRAVYLVTTSRRASVSGVQRHLRIGYNRAARLVEEMERAGIVGPLKPNGARDVLAEPPP
jgi:DNA segregation ATPase FtsK/SpoIIIE, S-DNA-T family